MQHQKDRSVLLGGLKHISGPECLRNGLIYYSVILNVHKERTDTLDLKDTLNSFVKGSQHRAGLFYLF